MFTIQYQCIPLTEMLELTFGLRSEGLLVEADIEPSLDVEFALVWFCGGWVVPGGGVADL